MEYFYGDDSLETSNIYVEIAQYYSFLNLPYKSLGCYLKAAKIRKEKSSICYYNAALILAK